MMRGTRAATFASVIMLASACAQITLVKPGPVKIDGAYTVEAAAAWNRMETGTAALWTLDGPLVQSVQFFTGISDNENIFQKEGSDDGPDKKFKNMPKFRQGMNALDIAELLVATLAQEGNTNVKSANLKNSDFGNRDGFRLQLQYSTENGLEKKAEAFGTIQADKLYLIIFNAPALYYFDRDIGRVERIVQSARFKAGATS